MPNKIRFRNLFEEDLKSVFAIYSDKEAMKFRGSQPIETLDDAKQFIANQKHKKGSVLTVRKGVELIQEQKLIGSVMLRYDHNFQHDCEIGYSIGRAFWGNGLGKEIVKELIILTKQDPNTENIKAWTNKNNIASIKVLESNDFQRCEQNRDSENYLYQKTNSD